MAKATPGPLRSECEYIMCMIIQDRLRDSRMRPGARLELSALSVNLKNALPPKRDGRPFLAAAYLAASNLGSFNLHIFLR